jgi:hypothetical protein
LFEVEASLVFECAWDRGCLVLTLDESESGAANIGVWSKADRSEDDDMALLRNKQSKLDPPSGVKGSSPERNHVTTHRADPPWLPIRAMLLIFFFSSHAQLQCHAA